MTETKTNGAHAADKTAATANAHDIKVLHPANVWQALGEVAAILSLSPGYKFFTLADLEWMVVPALQLGHYRLYGQNNQPVGVVMWAMLDDALGERMLDPRFKLRPEQWSCGSQMWVTDIVHTHVMEPGLTGAMLADVKSAIAGAHALRVRSLELIAKLRPPAQPATPG